MQTIPEFKLVAEPVDDDAKAMTFIWSDEGVGLRHKIGGKPDFLQEDLWPSCKECGDRMSFYGQLDSLHDKQGDFDIADCGMIYVFFCFDCFEAQAMVQSA